MSKIKSAVELDHRNKSELSHNNNNDASSSDDDDDDDENSISRGAFVLTKNDISDRMRYLITVTYDGVVHGCMVVCVREEEPTSSSIVEEEEGGRRRIRNSWSGGFLFETEHEVFSDGDYRVNGAMISTLQSFVTYDTPLKMDGMRNLHMIRILIFKDARAAATSSFLIGHGFKRVSEACSDRYLCWLTFEWRGA